MRKNNIPLLLIFLLTAFLLFFRLRATSLVNWDEAWIASVAQDIAVRNDWLGGQWNGQTWFYEPPIVTWSLAILYKIFGPSEFWLRSFNAAIGILIVVITYKLSVSITNSAVPAFISAIILLSDIEFLFRSRQVNVEIPVTFFLLLTVFYLLKWQIGSRRAGREVPDRTGVDSGSAPVELARADDSSRPVLAGASLGLAFLTKRASPILILPAMAYIFFARKNIKGVFIFLITLITIISPLFLINYVKWGNQFINEFILGYTLGKIRSVNPGAGTNFWFYITSLRHAFKLFFPLVPFAIVWATIKSFRDQKIAVLTIYILTFLIFLTIAPIKSSWFLLPIHPIIAVLTGLFIVSTIRTVLAVRQGQSFINYFVILLVTLISAWQLWHYKNNFIVPDTTGRQAALSQLAGELSKPRQPIYLDDDYLPVAVFYSRHRVIPLRFNRLQPITSLPIPSGSYILTNKETFPTLQNNYPNISLVKDSVDLILVQTTLLPP